MSYTVEVLLTEFVTHDVKRFIISRPDGFEYEPGQGVTLAVDEPDWANKTRPFTPTNLRDARVLEFTIKGYAEHDGVTRKLHSLSPGAQLQMSKAFGSLTYRGPGWFLAGGAGITPMMAMLRSLAAEDRLDEHGLVFASRTPADIICEKEFRHYLGDRCIFLCEDAQGMPYFEGRVTRELLAEHVNRFDQRFYTCGPPAFNKAVGAVLEELGAEPDALVFEG